jgi:hypothetical protein
MFTHHARWQFANSAEMLSDHLKTPFHRITEQRYIEPLDAAVLSLFVDYGVASVFIEHRSGRQHISCDYIFEHLGRSDLNREAFCQFLLYSSYSELVERHSTSTAFLEDRHRWDFSLSYHGAFFSEHHRHAQLHSTVSHFHHHVISQDLINAIDRRVKNPAAAVAADNDFLVALTSAYTPVLIHDSRFASCSRTAFVHGPQVRSFDPAATSADCVIFQSVTPFASASQLKTIVSALGTVKLSANQHPRRIFFLELTDQHFNNNAARFVNAFDLYMLAFGPAAAPDSTKIPQILAQVSPHMSSGQRTESPYFLYEVAA